jgi:hypothetical protein
MNGSVWDDSADKQKSREMVAKAIADQLGEGDRSRKTGSPKIFVLPGRAARCAKAINRLVPNAIFYGTDRIRRIYESTAAIDERGKAIRMQYNTVSQYIRDNTGSLQFDAAFLDYTSSFEITREEIIVFASQMLKAKAVFAVTVQRGKRGAVLDSMTKDLRGIAASVVLLGQLQYKTTMEMVNAIFLLTK